MGRGRLGVAASPVLHLHPPLGCHPPPHLEGAGALRALLPAPTSRKRSGRMIDFAGTVATRGGSGVPGVLTPFVCGCESKLGLSGQGGKVFPSCSALLWGGGKRGPWGPRHMTQAQRPTELTRGHRKRGNLEPFESHGYTCPSKTHVSRHLHSWAWVLYSLGFA